MAVLYSVVSLLGLVGLLGSCQRPATARYQYAAPVAAPAPVVRPEMVFLSFKAVATASGPATITLLQSTVAAGAPKTVPDGPDEAPAYLLVRQLGADGAVLHSVRAEHPLRRSVESAGADGRLRRQDVQLPEAEFFVRMVLAPQAKAVRVEEFVNRQPTGTTTITLPDHP